MELASLLAGEQFDDHPTSVCPVIGSFLRAYNDSIDDHRRQDLYAYASKVVGSRSSDCVQRARAERLTAWTYKHDRRCWSRLRRLRAAHRSALLDVHALAAVGADAVKSVRRHSDSTHAEALALIDELLKVYEPMREAPPRLEPIAASAQPALARASRGDASAQAPSDQRDAALNVRRARRTLTRSIRTPAPVGPEWSLRDGHPG